MDGSTLAEGELAPFAAILTSLAIGLLIGVERERNPSAKAGLRTFALTSLFGTLAAMLGEYASSAWLPGVGLTVGGRALAAQVILPAAASLAGGLAALALW